MQSGYPWPVGATCPHTKGNCYWKCPTSINLTINNTFTYTSVHLDILLYLEEMPAELIFDQAE